MKKIVNIKEYYNNPKGYLQEHDNFFKSSDINKDVNFIIKALAIKKTDEIIDIACGQGRHVNLFASKGYKIDGLDFSSTLLKLAREDSKRLKRKPSYFQSDLKNIKLKKKYNKAYWFFSDMANIDPLKAIKSISKIIKNGGYLLIDTDNVFRITNYLINKKMKDLYFDANNFYLLDKTNNVKIPYLSLIMWNNIFNSVGLKVIKTYGDYKLRKYQINSPRLIMIIKKTA